MNNCFYSEKIKDDIKKRIMGKSYKEDCTVPFEELRYVRVLYYGFDKKTHIGELIVNKAIASDIVAIFTELYENKYPIEQMVLVDEYEADDNASMAANNTSSFNYRVVPGSNHLSKHALGLAIDINPLYNPYIQYTEEGTIILPEEGSKYADRTLDCPYYINEDDLCYKAFTKRGFTWGGFWETEPDFQHFQKSF
ncbi:M15 family peptidase [Anaerocolumna sedimenticola]|uniref:M15 family peptidase n=2 Tax=Anaerocolumna sedimenticola TaxID=2696063 RepID=A0A6P1TT42_9FIRM|nr:M15 family peptidase [Anaerocolumna sedimenticola]